MHAMLIVGALKELKIRKPSDIDIYLAALDELNGEF